MDDHYTNTFELRDYQQELLDYQSIENTIAVIPTGAGKTFIAVAAVVECLNKNVEGKKALFLTENVSLAIQQRNVFEQYIEPKIKVSCLYGGVSSMVVGESMDCTVIVATVGCMLNLLTKGTYHLEEFCIVVFDEAHHAQKGHPFRVLMNDFYFTMEEMDRPRIMGLTASPGSKRDIEDTYREIYLLSRNLDARITTPIKNLRELETHTNYAAEVFEYVEFSDTEKQIAKLFYSYFKFLWDQLGGRFEIVPVPFDDIEASDWDPVPNLNTIRNYKQELLPNRKNRTEKDQIALLDVLMSMIDGYQDLNDISAWACIRNITETFHKVELTHSHLNLLDQPLPRYALYDVSVEEFCPKVEKLLQILENSPIDRVIIFAQRQTVCHHIKKKINHRFGDRMKASELVGHSSSTGMTVSKQRETVKKFNLGNIDVLVATSVAEEGLDIQGCNLVIRFDCMNTVTAMIQSRGRARSEDSKFIMIFRFSNAESKFIELKSRESEMLYAVQKIMTGEVTIENNPARRIWVEDTAVSILNEYCQLHRLPQPYYNAFQEGKYSHNLQFYMTAQIQHGEKMGEIKHIKGEHRSNKKKAKGSAAYFSLLHYHDTRGDVEETFKDKYIDVKSTIVPNNTIDNSSENSSDTKKRNADHITRVSDVDSITSGKNPVSFLNEFAQCNSMTTSFIEDLTGPPHNPTATCTWKCNYFGDCYEATAAGPNKKAAKNLACARILWILNEESIL